MRAPSPRATIVTGHVFPSAGVRVLIPLVVSCFIEDVSGLPMSAMSDYAIGVSAGSVPAAAFSFQQQTGSDDPFSARSVLYSTFAVAHAMFARDPKKVLTNNLVRDALAFLRTHTQGTRLGQVLSGPIQAYSPTHDAARYDAAILEKSLRRRFGARKITDADKSLFIIAHGVRSGTPYIFGHVDARAFPHGQTDALHIDSFPMHGDVAVSDAIMSATAMPGVIGYRHMDPLAEAFMDTGSFSAASYYAIMEDMHDMAAARVAQTMHLRPLWQKAADAARGHRAPETVSRLIHFGVGDESDFPFDTSNVGGILHMAHDAMRAAGDHVREFAQANIRRRFNAASLTHTGLPALQTIDLPIIPKGVEDPAGFPSPHIVDGQMTNMMALLAFGARVAVANRTALCDEIMLRMETLAARGLKSAADIAATGERLKRFDDHAAAQGVCDEIVFDSARAQSFLEQEGLATPKPHENGAKKKADKPADTAVTPATDSASTGWLRRLPLVRSTEAKPHTAAPTAPHN